MKKPIIYAITAVVIIALFIILLKTVFAEKDTQTETLYCGENNTKPVKVFKNPTEAFPAFAKEYTSKLTGSADLVDSVAAKASGNFELNSKIIELRDKLNQESSRLELLLKSNFYAYNSNPCDSNINKKYFDLLTILTEKTTELERLRAELTVPASKGNADSSILIPISDTSQIREAIEKFIVNYKFSE